MIHGRSILTGRLRWEPADALALALTPGIPFEWVVNVGRIGDVRKSELKRLMISASREDFARADDNAATITDSDAWAMLRATPTNYRGAVPLYVQLALQASPESDRAVAEQFGFNRDRVRRWRTKQVFDPLTGDRLIQPLGAPR